MLSLYLFVTAAATPIGAVIWGTSADVAGIDVTIAASGVVLLLGVGLALVSILRRADVPANVARTAATAPAAD